MKKYLILLLFTTLFEANAQIREKAINVVPRQVRRLYSAYNIFPGEKNKLVIPVQLPPNTLRWYYAFSAFREESDVRNQRNIYGLFSKLTKLIDETGTSLLAVNLLTQPPGSDNCEVYLLGSLEDKSLFEQYTQAFPTNFKRYIDLSKTQFVSGVVSINNQNLLSGTQYIGIRNPHPLYDITVSMEVVAIVAIPDIQKNWYNQGYNEGYSKGYNEGYNKGSNEGYNKGSNEGYNKGSNEGYSRGSGEGYNRGYNKWLYEKRKEYNRFGIKGGINLAKIAQSSQSSDLLSGYNGGLLYSILLNQKFSIQPELLYTVKGGRDDNFLTETKIPMIQLPLLLKYKFAGWNTKYFVNGGAYGAYVLNINGLKPSETTIEYGVTGGVGMEIPNLGEGKVLIEARYDYGLGFNNKNAFSSSDFHTNVIGISVGFLF